MTTLPHKRESPSPEHLKRIEQLYDWGYIAWDSTAGCARLTQKGWSALASIAEPPIPKPPKRLPSER